MAQKTQSLQMDPSLLKPANSAKVEELKESEGAETPTEAPEIKETAKEESEEPQEQTEKGATSNNKKHVLKYVATGAWIDQEHRTWAKNHENPDIIDTMTISDDEYQSRQDLQFMVSYGAITDVVVE